jgi:IclR family acetate operon transcriptional repressor
VSESLRKAMLILDELCGSETELSARELAGRLDVPKSTAQRLLRSLEDAQMAEQDPVTRKYRLGPRTLTLGMAYRHRLDLRNVALPHMRRLRDATDETIGLSVAIDDTRMFIEEVQSQSELRAHSELGQPYPIWTGAPGRVLLAYMPQEGLGRILGRADDQAWRPIDPPTREGLLAALRQIVRQGFECARDETIRGISAVAVPVTDATGLVVAALSVSGPTHRMTGDMMDSVVPRARETGAVISRALGSKSHVAP